MHIHSLPRLALALAIVLATGAAVAAPPRDNTRIEIGKNGNTEVVVLDDMAIGESRQLYSEAGTLVTAVRTNEAIELDIGGDKTRVTLPDPDLSPEAIARIVAGAGDGSPAIVRIQRDGAAAGAEGKQRVVMIASKDGSVETIDAEDVKLLVDGDALVVDGGKRVIVQRTRAADGDSDTP